MTKNAHFTEPVAETESASESESESPVEGEDEGEVVEFDGNIENLLSIRHVLTASRESAPRKMVAK